MYRTRTALASTAVAGLAVAAMISVATPAAADSQTTAVAAVEAGALSISAPTALTLGSAAPGTTGSATLEGVVVTDDRAGTDGWVASVTVTDFSSASVDRQLPASALTYAPGQAVVTGTATLTPSTVTGSTTAAAVQTAAAVSGNNTATWDATVGLAVPADALAADDYTATITQSVA